MILLMEKNFLFGSVKRRICPTKNVAIFNFRIYLNEILIERYADESNEFEKHVQALEYVQRIQLYYQTLSILNREKEMHLLAIN